jgi:hypothetical protein
LWLGVGLTTPHLKNVTCYEMFQSASDLDWLFFVGRPEGKRPLGRPRRRWEDDIKIDLRDIGIDGVNWIRLAQDRVR